MTDHAYLYRKAEAGYEVGFYTEHDRWFLCSTWAERDHAADEVAHLKGGPEHDWHPLTCECRGTGCRYIEDYGIIDEPCEVTQEMACTCGHGCKPGFCTDEDERAEEARYQRSTETEAG